MVGLGKCRTPRSSSGDWLLQVSHSQPDFWPADYVQNRQGGGIPPGEPNISPGKPFVHRIHGKRDNGNVCHMHAPWMYSVASGMGISMPLPWQQIRFQRSRAGGPGAAAIAVV